MEPMYNRILFLDLDGVMTNTSDGTSYLCGNPESYHLSEDAKANLLELKREFPDLKVVILSSWLNYISPRDNLLDDKPQLTFKDKKFKTPLPELYQFLTSEPVNDENKLYLDFVSRYLTDDEYSPKCESKFEKIRWWWHRARQEDLIGSNTRALVLDDDYGEKNGLREIKKLRYWGVKIGFHQVFPRFGFDKNDLFYAKLFFKD